MQKCCLKLVSYSACTHTQASLLAMHKDLKLTYIRHTHTKVSDNGEIQSHAHASTYQRLSQGDQTQIQKNYLVRQ